jgi:uncharacterized membrane protein (DUF4010 family)
MDETLFEKLGLSLAIGFLIGVERGWKQREEMPGERAAGLRTFTLAGLFGGLSALAGQALGALAFAALAISFAAVFGAFMWRESAAEGEHSATSAVAGLTTFALGATAGFGQPVIAAAAAVATVTVLAFKEALHAWLRALTWPEIRSAFLILAMTFIALPLVPTGPIDPWGLMHARELWLLTILIAAASFAGYVAIKVFGARTGLALGAACGAIVSSTVVTMDLARRVTAKEAAPIDGAAGAAIASAVMVLRVAALTLVVSPAVFGQAAPALAAALFAATAAAGALFLADGWRGGANGLLALRSPLDFRAVFRFAGILALFSVVAQLATRSFGASAILPFAALSGLVDVDAVVLAISRLPATPTQLAADAILLAIAADTISKCIIAGVVGGRIFFGYFALASALTLAAGAAMRFLGGNWGGP